MADSALPGAPARRRPPLKTGGRKSKTRKPAFATWSAMFLAELASTSNVSASARAAGIGTAAAYEARRINAEFNRAGQQALCEGYEHLEMEVLGRLRAGEIRPAGTAKRGVRQFDNGAALRLLLAHRESAAQQRAIRDNADADAILASIDAKLDMMRERSQQTAHQTGQQNGARKSDET